MVPKTGLRILLIVGLLATLTDPSRAQTETLMGENVTHGGFGGISYHVASISGEIAHLRGARGGWILNLRPRHAISLGLSSYDLENDVPVAIPSDDDGPTTAHLQLDIDGFELEYVYRSRRLLHLAVPVLIGGGEVSYDLTEEEQPEDQFFAINPAVLAEINVATWFRVGVGGSYRWISGVDLSGVTDSDIAGFSGTVHLKFGGFGLSE